MKLSIPMAGEVEPDLSELVGSVYCRPDTITEFAQNQTEPKRKYTLMKCEDGTRKMLTYHSCLPSAMASIVENGFKGSPVAPPVRPARRPLPGPSPKGKKVRSILHQQPRIPMTTTYGETSEQEVMKLSPLLIQSHHPKPSNMLHMVRSALGRSHIKKNMDQDRPSIFHKYSP